MDDARFDALSRTLAAGRSRRGLGRLLAGLALAGPLGQAAASARKRRKKRRSKKTGCSRQEKPCGRTCLPRDQCCNDGDCGSAALRCCRGTCIPSDACCGSGECLGGASCQDGACVCPNGERLCPGGCLNVECCADSHCTGITGHICSDQQCVCPFDKPDICNGACMPACLSAIIYARRPNCECCLKNGVGHGGQVGQCCSDRGSSTGTCQGRPPGDPCDFSEQCANNFCLCGAFGCACQ